MCFGGGGGGGVITMPDTAAYDRLAQQQMDAMKAVQDSGVKYDQQRLNSSLVRQQDQLAQLKEVTAQRANETAAQAKRLAELMGAPPPEKTAQTPVLGSARGEPGTRGKAALRIERPTATSSGPGAGINIT